MTSSARWLGRAVAILAGDLDGRADLAIELGVSVVVLGEVAIGAVHAALQVDVEQMHGHAFAALPVCRSASLAGVMAAMSFSVPTSGNDVALVVEQVAGAVLLEDRPEDPAVPVKIGELRVPRCGVQVGDVLQEVGIGPVAPRRGLLGIRHVARGPVLRP